MKIYAYRVDSVHNDAFKALAGFNRAALPPSQTELEEGEVEEAGEPIGCTASAGLTLHHHSVSAHLAGNV